MTEEQAINIIRTYLVQQFPKDCKVCGQRFSSLKEYLQNTIHAGYPHSFDAEMGNWRSQKSFGTFSFADCKCGNNLAISSSGMGVMTMRRLMRWAWKETSRRRISAGEFLNDLRLKVDNQVLSQEESFQNVIL